MNLQSTSWHSHRARIATRAIAALATLAAATAAHAGVLDRVHESGKLRLGYRTDARPFSYRDEGGNPTGYSVALCQKIAAQIKGELGLPALAVDWVAVSTEGRLSELQQGTIDLLCGATSVTLNRRGQVSFSIPIFPGGIGVILRGDTPFGLLDPLSGRPPTVRGTGSATQGLQGQTVSVVTGTTSQTWLANRLEALQIQAIVVPVQSYEAGIRRVLERSSSAFFGDRAILWDAGRRSGSMDELKLLERHFTYEPIALALARGDEDLRLLVDQVLSRLYRSAAFRGLFADWFGDPDEETLTFFRLTALPD